MVPRALAQVEVAATVLVVQKDATAARHTTTASTSLRNGPHQLFTLHGAGARFLRPSLRLPHKNQTHLPRTPLLTAIRRLWHVKTVGRP